jgi:hypothetical protein
MKGRREGRRERRREGKREGRREGREGRRGEGWNVEREGGVSGSGLELG